MGNFGELFDRIFVLNLWNRSLRRRLSTVYGLASLGVTNYEFLPGVEGDTLNLESMMSDGSLKIIECESRYMSQGEAGCLLSHRMAWEENLQRGYDTVLIVEDDTVWHTEANKWMEAWMFNMPEDWDIVHFYSNETVGSREGIDLRRESIGDGIWRGYNEGSGAVCYAVKKRACVQLLKWSWPLSNPTDGVTNWLTGDWEECGDYNGYIVSPFPCHPGCEAHQTASLTHPRLNIDVFRDVFDKSQKLEGWFEEVSWEKLCNIQINQMRNGLRGDILEIGCYHGKSACTLANFLAEGETLHLCDVFDLPESKLGHAYRGSPDSVFLSVPDDNTIIKNITEISGVEPDRLVIHKHSSLELPEKLEKARFRMIHVDGRHDFEYVLSDIQYSYQHLIENGIIIVDDWRNKDWPEVGLAVINILQSYHYAELIDYDFHKCYLGVSTEKRKRV